MAFEDTSQRPTKEAVTLNNAFTAYAQKPEYQKLYAEGKGIDNKVLTDFYTQATKGVEAKPIKRVVEVPREQLPIGEGKEKISRLEARVKEALGKISPEDQEKLGLTTYNQMNKKENISKAVDYVTKNQEEALKVLEGKAETPKGIARNSIYVAMENMAKGDVELARKLASLSSTRMGQELSILSELDPESPVRIMRDIIKIREGEFKRKYKGRTTEQAKNKVVEDIKKSVKLPDRIAWTNFLKSIEC